LGGEMGGRGWFKPFELFIFDCVKKWAVLKERKEG